MSVKSELVILISGYTGIPAQEYYSDEEAIDSLGRTPFTNYFVGVGDEEVEFPASRPRGYYIKKSTINLLMFCKANSHSDLQTNLNSLYSTIYTAKASGVWASMPNLLQAKVLTADPEEKINEKVFMTKIPVEISELIEVGP